MRLGFEGGADNESGMIANLSDDTRIARAETMVASEVNGEVVILDIDSGLFFQLNPIGSKVWDLLESPATLAQMVAALQAKFNVSAEQCRADVAEFVEKMLERGLLVRA